MPQNQFKNTLNRKKGLDVKSRADLFNNKFAFEKDELILLNALDIIDELSVKDIMLHENAKLKDRIELLESLIYIKSPEPEQYQIFDIKI